MQSTESIIEKRPIKIPPNILILTDDQEEFNVFRKFLLSIIGTNTYTVYRIDSNDLMASNLWMTNCILLIEAQLLFGLEDKLDSYVEFVKYGGSILSVPCLKQRSQASLKRIDDSTNLIFDAQLNFENNFQNDLLFEKRSVWFDSHQTIVPDDLIHVYTTPLFTGQHFVSRLFFLNYEASDALSRNEYTKNIFFKLFKEKLNFKISDSPKFKSDFYEQYQTFTKNMLLQSVNIIECYLNEHLNKNSKFQSKNRNENSEKYFNSIEYFENLKTKKFGTIVLYTQLTNSTMNTFESLPNSIDNVIVVARQQTKAEGNNRNQWLSPLGCCAFTLFLKLNSDDFSTARLCLLQFVAALACVKAITNTPNHNKLAFKIKWPNDIYFNRTTKIGGVLVKSSLMGNSVFVKIGVGFNLSNEHPTECLNKILRENNLAEWKPETFIAKFLNQFEYYFNKLNSTNYELREVIHDYEENWLHKDQIIKVNYWNENVDILGINEFGYLRVKRSSDKSEHNLQPDGNRFDIMHNLIVFRT